MLCKSFTVLASSVVFISQSLANIHPLVNQFEHVSNAPRALHDEDRFAVYWAVWRSSSAEEQNAFREREGVLVHHRKIEWDTRSCGGQGEGRKLSQDGEEFWFADKIQFDEEAKLITIPEAGRADHSYHVLLNANSLYLKHQKAFQKPARIFGEGGVAFQKRVAISYREYIKNQTLRFTKGRITVTSEFESLFQSELVANFRSLRDFQNDKNFQDILEKFHPKHWPIFYDERAHKNHQFEEALIKENAEIFSKDFLKGTVEWDWCEESQVPQLTFYNESEESISPGPNRGGREAIGYQIPSFPKN